MFLVGKQRTFEFLSRDSDLKFWKIYHCNQHGLRVNEIFCLKTVLRDITFY